MEPVGENGPLVWGRIFRWGWGWGWGGGFNGLRGKYFLRSFIWYFSIEIDIIDSHREPTEIWCTVILPADICCIQRAGSTLHWLARLDSTTECIYSKCSGSNSCNFYNAVLQYSAELEITNLLSSFHIDKCFKKIIIDCLRQTVLILVDIFTAPTPVLS